MPEHIRAPERRSAATRPPAPRGLPAGQRWDEPPPGRRSRPRHRRPPSRRVRLRRTIAVLALLGVGVASVWFYWGGPGKAVATSAVGASSSAASVTAPIPTAGSTSSGAEESPPTSTTTSPTTPSKVVERGNGKFTVVPVPAMKNPATSGRVVRYTVEAEGGLGADTNELAATVERVLLDDRSWQHEDRVRFVNVSPKQADAGWRVDIRVTLASPKTTDRLCAPMRTLSQVSCWNGSRSVLNLRRWLFGAQTWGSDLAGYRTYMINHEVGHGLGHGHQQCPSPGARAPVMVQQTLSLEGCRPWAWPKGDGA